MTLHEATPARLSLEDVKGTVWERLTALKDGEGHPFKLASPGRDENPLLAPGEVRRISYRSGGQVLLYNIDLPAGVTLDLVLDGASQEYSPGNEAGTLRWESGTSPLRFTNSLDIILTNTTGVAATYRIHVSGV